MPGDGSRSQGNAAAFGPLFFVMAAEGRYGCREVICRAVRWGGACSGAVFFVAACRGTKCCRRAKRWLRGAMPGGLFGRAVGAIPGRLGCRFVRSPILRRRLLVAGSYGCRFVRGVFLSGRFSRWRFFRRLPAAGLPGLICLSADFPGCRFVRRSACRCGRLSSPIRRKCQ